MGKLPKNLCSLIELRISRCPEFSLKTPIQLSRLKRFEVIGSSRVGVVFNEAQLFTSQLDRMKQIEKLCIADCNSLSSLLFSILPRTLKRVRIFHCQKLKLERLVGEIFLDELSLLECDCRGSLELLARAQKLFIESFPNVTKFLIHTATKSLYTMGCENVEKLSVACANLPSAMTCLCICGC